MKRLWCVLCLLLRSLTDTTSTNEDAPTYRRTNATHRVLTSEGVTTKEVYHNAYQFLSDVLNVANARIRPNIYGHPVSVVVNFYVQSFGPVNEVNMDFQLVMFFYQQWIDPRLTFIEHPDPLSITNLDIDKIWKPDLYFPNEESGVMHEVTAKNQFINIYPNGTVRYSSRMTVKFSCNMYLGHFPMDHQKCYIRISSYSYNKKNVILKWSGTKPVEIPDMKNFKLKQFYVTELETTQCSVKHLVDYSCLQANFHMKRQMGSYLLSTYVPSVLIVMLSWVSFWISKDAVPARISLGVTTVLTMTTQLGSTMSVTLQVSYPRAIDIWYTTCLAFVFFAQLEYAVVNVLSRSEKMSCESEDKRRRSVNNLRGNSRKSCDPKNSSSCRCNSSCQHSSGCSATHDSEVDDAVFESPPVRHSRTMSQRGCLPNCVRYYCTTSKGIDSCSRFIFPFIFIVFNLAYWPYYSQKVIYNETEE